MVQRFFWHALSAAIVVVLALSATGTTAKPLSQRSPALDDHVVGSELYLNERGELEGSLFNERGEMHLNPRINLNSEKRQSPGFKYGSQKVRGVNIGGWLVAEPWITPSLFDDTGDSRVIDEWTLGKYVSDAGSRLESHWASFITADDFRQIAAAGLNHVRIPIGYWALDKGDTPFYKGSQYSYLKRAIGWARNSGLKVIVDLHGAPGSQNGFDNSGHKISPPRWFNSESYKSRAIAVLQRFAKDFAGETDVVTSIELLNEPFTVQSQQALDFTRDFYTKGIATVRRPNGGSGSQSNFAITIHDGFQPLNYWQGAYQPPQYQQILLDTHIYSVFNFDQIALSDSARLQSYCNQQGSIASSNANLYTIVGEWTTAPTDCARYLNGRGVGARYDGSYPGSTRQGSCSGKTGSGRSFSSSYKSFLRQMFDTQRKVFEQGSGWVYWTWKTESAADWDYQRGLNGGWLTRNLNDFSSSSC